jgi:hypothetical protein
MLIWGSSGKMVAAGDGGTAYCDLCKERRSFTNFVSYTVRHIWYLIRWATGLRYHRRCGTCHNLFDMAAPPATDALSGGTVKTKSPIPVFDRWGWAFGLGAIAVLIGIAVIAGNQDKAEEAVLVAAPQRGDLYEVAVDRFLPATESQSVGSDYGVFRVERVSGGTVTLAVPRIVYSRSSGSRNAISNGEARSDAYFDGTVDMPLATIQARHADGTIQDVVR